jgi:hypothetical protein
LLSHLSIRSYETVVKRWPVILTTVIDSVYSENHELTNLPEKADMLEEGKALIGTLSRLKYDMARDRALEYVVSPFTRQRTALSEADAPIALRRPMPADGEALVDEYNAELARLEERGQNTWFTAPWLYAEYALMTVPAPVA